MVYQTLNLTTWGTSSARCTRLGRWQSKSETYVDNSVEICPWPTKWTPHEDLPWKTFRWNIQTYPWLDHWWWPRKMEISSQEMQNMHNSQKVKCTTFVNSVRCLYTMGNVY